MKSNGLIIVSLMFGIFFASPVLGDFIITEESEDVYGNGHLVVFDRAIGGDLGLLTCTEKEELADILPLRDIECFYGRFRINQSTLQLNDIRNRSTGAIFKNGAVINNHTSLNQVGVEFALGYIWSKSFRADIEYLLNKNITYSSSPVLSGSPFSLTATLKNNPVLINFYYDFTFEGGRFKPYLTAGIGGSFNSVQSMLTPTPFGTSGSSTKQSLGWAWALGGGMRVGIFSRWYLDLSVRYINLATVRIEPVSSFELLTNYSMNAISLGVIYLF